MRERTRDAIQKALSEAFFVVLAVGLALAANERRQVRADRGAGALGPGRRGRRAQAGRRR